jgi:hypothetical protein
MVIFTDPQATWCPYSVRRARENGAPVVSSDVGVSFRYNSHTKSSFFVLEGNLLKGNVENTSKHVRRPGDPKHDAEFVQARDIECFCKTYQRVFEKSLDLKRLCVKTLKLLYRVAPE